MLVNRTPSHLQVRFVRNSPRDGTSRRSGHRRTRRARSIFFYIIVHAHADAKGSSYTTTTFHVHNLRDCHPSALSKQPLEPWNRIVRSTIPLARCAASSSHIGIGAFLCRLIINMMLVKQHGFNVNSDMCKQEIVFLIKTVLIAARSIPWPPA